MLARALKSILDQTYQDFEIIVVNDAGEDVENIIRSQGNEKRIRYLKHNSNKGLAAARNTGLKASCGKYIAYLDDDDIYYENHLETLVGFLEKSDFKIAYADTRRAVQEMKDGTYEVISRNDMSVEFDYDQILVGNLIPVLCFMHEKACLDDVGFFDENLTSHEDWDLWIRMSRRFEIGHIRKITSEFNWRLDGSTMTSGNRVGYLKTLEIIYNRYRAYAEGNPVILRMQKEHFHLERSHTDDASWQKRERLKIILARFIGLKGIAFLYRWKLRLGGIFSK